MVVARSAEEALDRVSRDGVDVMVLDGTASGRRRPARVLVAEDNVINQKIAVRMVEKLDSTARTSPRTAGRRWKPSRASPTPPS